jgi:hypothetical protein
MKKIQMLIESREGHTELDVDENEIQEEVEEQLEQDKWATLEKENGETEILTKSDIPTQKVLSATSRKSEEEKWAEKFTNLKSATITTKAKGG